MSKNKKNSSKVKISKKNKKLLNSIKDAEIYHIVWMDAFSEVDEWHDKATIDSEDYLCQTVGYLISNTSKKNYYTVASTFTIDKHFSCVIHIPKSMVILKKKVPFSGVE